MIRVIALAGLAAASFAATAADIQKCADASGQITYQDAPCPSGSMIGTVPRESAHGDPAALRQLERDKARLERAAEARIAAEAQQQAAPVIIQQPQAGGTMTQPGVPAYAITGPVNFVDPSTGAVIVQGTSAVIDPNTGTVISLGTTAPVPSNVTTPNAITPSPAATKAPAVAAPR